MKRNLVLVTDCVDVAYNELRGVLWQNLRGFEDEVQIEPVVPVAPFSIINGNFTLRLLAESYPENTIFSVILNPMKERPARILGQTENKNFYFLGANTGVFTWFFRDFGIKQLYELNDPGFFPFGGKYVHAPAAANIAKGVELKALGRPFERERILTLDIGEGTIVHIDNFGLMKFTGSLTGLNEGDRLLVTVNGNTLSAIYSKRMMSNETGVWAMYPGSSYGLPEFGKVRCQGAEELGVHIGDKITFSKV